MIRGRNPVRGRIRIRRKMKSISHSKVSQTKQVFYRARRR
jgi:hypothetical protein